MKPIFKRILEGGSKTSQYFGFSYFKLPDWSIHHPRKQDGSYNEFTFVFSPTNKSWFEFKTFIHSNDSANLGA